MHFVLCNNHVICWIKQWFDNNLLHFVLIYEYFFVKITYYKYGWKACKNIV